MKPKLRDVLNAFYQTDQSKDSKEQFVHKLTILYSNKEKLVKEDDPKYLELSSKLNRIFRSFQYHNASLLESGNRLQELKDRVDDRVNMGPDYFDKLAIMKMRKEKEQKRMIITRKQQSAESAE